MLKAVHLRHRKTIHLELLRHTEAATGSVLRKAALNPNKAGFFEGSFSWGKGGQFDPPSLFIFQEELILFQYNFIQLLNNLFKVC